MPEIRIEPLDPEQADVKMLIATSDAFYEELYPAESNHLEAADDLASPGVLFLGCRLDGRLVGSGAAKLMQDDGQYAEIKRVFVLEDSRGLGLSAEIMRHLESGLRERGVELVRLETGIYQPEAMGLYRKLGYREREPFGRYTPDPLSVFMEKRLVPFFRIASIGTGFLAILAHPGLQQDAALTLADLALQGVKQVVSLLETDESRMLGLEAEAEMVTAAGMRFVSFPITDMGLPGSVESFADLSYRIFSQVAEGVSTAVHCRAGIGRSGLLAAAVLLHDDTDVTQAFERVARLRARQVPETVSQGEWLLSNQQLVRDASGAGT